MLKHVDLYLGVFLILCGFAISLLNLRYIVSSRNRFSYIFLSENVLLICIGVAFLCRALHLLHPLNIRMDDVELRTAGFKFNTVNSQCGFYTLLMSYGPFVVSLVNSFLGLVIDNYLHYRMLLDMKTKDEENVVQEIGESSRSVKEVKLTKVRVLWKKYFSVITITLQWIMPILIALFMYTVDVKEILMHEARSIEDSCIASLQMSDVNCYSKSNYTGFESIPIELRKNSVSPTNYLDVIEKEQNNVKTSTQIDTILSNVLNIVRNFNNQTDFEYTNLTKSLRQPKLGDICMKMCFTDNKNMVLYMFVFAFVSYFIPITISMVILTKIHVLDVNRPSAKTYVTRELLYNILFWTPAMFDTFISLIMCSFAMHGLRTSLLNVIANVYQAIKNFMQTKYFKENAVFPM